MTGDIVPTGVPDLDRALLGGLLLGDNVVWVSSNAALCDRVEQLLVEGTQHRERVLYVSAYRSESEIHRTFGDHVAALDVREGRGSVEHAVLEQAIVTAAKDGATRIIVDGLKSFSRRWGVQRATAFFKRVCPRLFDLGAIAYWRVSRSGIGSAGIEDISKVTQCVFEVRDRHLRIIKAEGRPAAVQGRLFRISENDSGIHLHDERALGRLAESLRKLRNERTLSQADLGRLAGVSPSAISQTEAGQRGLSLDTLLTLTNALGIGLDDLLENDRRPNYVLARRARGTELGESRFLLDDPAAGLRVFLVNLGPHERGAPPVKHKGAELVLVARGLVLVDLGTSSPAVRAGDAILATKAPILSWRNLAPDPSVLFWILRD
jgi:transcriptional regulator with XRE-family HTH domain